MATIVENFNTAGATTWLSPLTGTVDILCIGAGGGGGVQLTGAGGGGGGGASAATTGIAVTAGVSYNLTVGAGGASGLLGTDSTWDTNVVVAKGGSPGLGTTGGAGGTAAGSTGTTKFNGGTGGAGQLLNTGGGGGGSSAGTTGAGGAGAAGSGSTGGAGGVPPDADAGTGGDGDSAGSGGSAGQQPGGGGGGAAATGYAGATGLVRISYADPATSTAVSGTPLIPHVRAGLNNCCGTMETMLNSLSRQGEIVQTDVQEYSIVAGAGFVLGIEVFLPRVPLLTSLFLNSDADNILKNQVFGG